MRLPSEVLGTKPALGRLISPTDDISGAAEVVVMSDALWRRRFGADSTVLGRRLTLNGLPWTVIGVLPPAFRLKG